MGDKTKLLNDMLKIDDINIWDLPNNEIGLCFKNFSYTKDGYFLKGEFGVGRTFEEALRDYSRIISGKTLVSNPDGKNRKEIKILTIGG